MNKLIIIEENPRKAESLQCDILTYFKTCEIEIISHIENADLPKFEDCIFASYDIMIINQLQNFFGADKIKTRILDGFSSPFGNVFCAGLEKAFVEEIRNIDYPIDCLIDEVFMVLGLRRHLTGTMYLKAAIKMAVETPYILMRSITTQLYPHIAEQFDTTPSKVERAIRHCIDSCYDNNRFVMLNSLFHANVFNENDKPSNGEFIALVADKILLRIDNHNLNKIYSFS